MERVMKIGTILYKVLMAITGLAWFGFLIGHLSGNFLLFKGTAHFNQYAHFLESLGGLLIVAELGLVAMLAAHIYSALTLTWGINGPARPTDYKVKANRGQATLASRTMIVGGIIIVLFIVAHISSFKYGLGQAPLAETAGGLYGRVYGAFQQPLVAIIYIVALIALGLHLSHGVASAFQTLGLLKRNWLPGLRKLGLVVGWAIACGFLLFPVAGLLGLLPAPQDVPAAEVMHEAQPAAELPVQH